MFLLSLLFLWVNVQAASACTCEDINWEAAKCPDNNKTVVLVNVTSLLSESSSNGLAISSTYSVKVQTFEGGPSNTLYDASMTLHNCSIPWTTDTPPLDRWYMIAGDKDIDGFLHVFECDMEPYKVDFFSKTGRERLYNIFLGHSQPTCQGHS